MRRKGNKGNVATIILLMRAALFYSAPDYVTIADGLKHKSCMSPGNGGTLPRDLSGSGVGYAWDAWRPYMWNSLKMAIPATIGSSLIGKFVILGLLAGSIEG